jgi:SAM-dependent methyltransferase
MIGTYKLLVNLSKKKRVLKYRFFQLLENVRGLDTLKYVDVEELGFSENIGYRYEGTSIKIIKKVLRDLKIHSGDRIIDVGCGKGSALIGFSKFPFKRITGLEISNELLEICKKNLNILKINNVDFIKTNALYFNHYMSYNYIYFYNPFPESTFRVVLNNIITATSTNRGNSIYIIYKNPTCHDIIINSGYFDLIKKYRYKNLAYPLLDYIYLYKSKYTHE